MVSKLHFSKWSFCVDRIATLSDSWPRQFASISILWGDEVTLSSAQLKIAIILRLCNSCYSTSIEYHLLIGSDQVVRGPKRTRRILCAQNEWFQNCMFCLRPNYKLRLCNSCYSTWIECHLLIGSDQFWMNFRSNMTCLGSNMATFSDALKACTSVS